MATNTRDLNEEIDITIALRVKIKNAYSLLEMTNVDWRAHTEEAKRELKKIVEQKIINEYNDQELTNKVYYNYTIKNSEEAK